MKKFAIPIILTSSLLVLSVSPAWSGRVKADPPTPADETRLGVPLSREGETLFPDYSGCGGVTAPIVNFDYEQEVVELVNAERASRSLPPLKRSAELDDASRYHATDLGQDNYFEHDTYDRVDGQLVFVCNTWARIQSYYSSPCAENIAAGFSTPQSVMNAWMGSGGHRGNILSTYSREIGVGYYQGSGYYYRYWVQDFGRRSDVYPLIINGEAATTTSRQVSLYVYGTWDEIRLRNDDGPWSAWQSFQSNLDWTLDSGRGEHTVWAEMRSGSQTASSNDSIYLDVVDIPPGSVTVSGPVTGLVQDSHTFMAVVGPDTATQPLTYVWQATDQAVVTHAGGLNDAVSFTWSTPGPKTITVSVTNDGGTATANHVIVVNAPLTAVNLSGPTSGFFNTFYYFDATVSPITATAPITYVWQATGHYPVTRRGDLNETWAFAWGLTGTQSVTVTARNFGSADVSATRTITVAEVPPIVVEPGITDTLTLVYTDGQGNSTTIAVPPQAFTYPLTLRYVPLTTTWPPSSGWAFAGHAWRLEAYRDGVIQPELVFAPPLTATVQYSEADVRAIKEHSLALFYRGGDEWTGAATTCGLPDPCDLQSELQRLLAILCRPGEFAMFGEQDRVYLPLVYENHVP